MGYLGSDHDIFLKMKFNFQTAVVTHRLIFGPKINYFDYLINALFLL